MLHRFFTQKTIVLCCIILVLSTYGIGTFIKNRKNTVPQINLAPISEIQLSEKNKEIQRERERESDALLSSSTKKERAEILGKKADYLALNNQFQEALDIYERVIDLSSSKTYTQKAASIAFKSRQYTKSIAWYRDVLPLLTLQEKEQLLFAMRYTKDTDFQKVLNSIDIPAYVRLAHEVSAICENTFIDCEGAIRKYPYDYAPINNLRKALDDFKVLKSTDINYKEALLIGAFYENKDYSTVIRIGANLLSRKPDYRPVLKIVGFSAYLTNQFDRAENALKKYKSVDSKDPEVDFLLGLIYFERQDYKLSNLYFNNAVLGGYKPKIVVERKLAYNYGILGQNKNMFQVLSHLLENPEVTEMDIVNALYLSLTEKEDTFTQKWIKVGFAKYPSSQDILALRAWNMRVNGKPDTALVILNDILSKNPNHLIALIQAGILHYEKGEKETAKTLLEKAKNINAGGTWSTTIEKYLSGEKKPGEEKNITEPRIKN